MKGSNSTSQHHHTKAEFSQVSWHFLTYNCFTQLLKLYHTVKRLPHNHTFITTKSRMHNNHCLTKSFMNCKGKSFPISTYSVLLPSDFHQSLAWKGIWLPEVVGHWATFLTSLHPTVVLKQTLIINVPLYHLRLLCWNHLHSLLFSMLVMDASKRKCWYWFLSFSWFERNHHQPLVWQWNHRESSCSSYNTLLQILPGYTECLCVTVFFYSNEWKSGS